MSASQPTTMASAGDESVEGGVLERPAERLERALDPPDAAIPPDRCGAVGGTGPRSRP